MTADWVSWAVPKPSLEQVVRGALGIENLGMGYNSTFRYPRQGGIGVLPHALAKRVPATRYGCRVEQVDLRRRVVRLADGEELSYERLVNTLPLPTFLGMLRGGAEELERAAADLDWSVVACLNLGVDRADLGDGAHWIYFPDDDVPFYRVGFPSNISPGVAPAGCGSMYVEFGLRRDEAFDPEDLARRGIEALRGQGLLGEADRILVRDMIRIDPGYVVFDRARQRAMATVLPALEGQGIHSIGRYGAWTYSYMERALLDGLELAQQLADQRVGDTR